MTKEDLLRDLEIASQGVRKQLTVAAGARKAENAYGEAYTKCVQAGLKPKLKKKYR